MDFGFDGFLDKFEQHFGKAATKCLLLLIGMAIAAVCIGLIWQWLISPVLTFLQAPGRMEAIGRILVAGATISTGALIAIRFYEVFLGGKLGRREAARIALNERIRVTEELTKALLAAAEPARPTVGPEERGGAPH